MVVTACPERSKKKGLVRRGENEPGEPRVEEATLGMHGRDTRFVQDVHAYRPWPGRAWGTLPVSPWRYGILLENNGVCARSAKPGRSPPDRAASICLAQLVDGSHPATAWGPRALRITIKER